MRVIILPFVPIAPTRPGTWHQVDSTRGESIALNMPTALTYAAAESYGPLTNPTF